MSYATRHTGTMTGMTAPTNEPQDDIVDAYVHAADCAGEKCDGPHCPPADEPDDPLHTIHVKIDAFGSGVLTVDGHDLSNHVAKGGVTIQAGDQKTRVTKCYVELMGGVTYDGPAEVTIVQGAHAVEFLQSVNPDHLAKAALTRGFNRNPIEVALEVLIEMAQAVETGEPSA